MFIMTHHPHLLTSLLPSDAQSRVLVKNHVRLRVVQCMPVVMVGDEHRISTPAVLILN
jgi:hypothetical protein